MIWYTRVKVSYKSIYTIGCQLRGLIIDESTWPFTIESIGTPCKQYNKGRCNWDLAKDLKDSDFNRQSKIQKWEF